MSATIEVLVVRGIENGGNVRAFVSPRIGFAGRPGGREAATREKRQQP